MGKYTEGNCEWSEWMFQVWEDYSPLLSSVSPSQSESSNAGRKRRTKSQVGSQISNYFSRRKVSELRSSWSVEVEQSLQPPATSEYVRAELPPPPGLTSLFQCEESAG